MRYKKPVLTGETASNAALCQRKKKEEQVDRTIQFFFLWHRAVNATETHYKIGEKEGGLGLSTG